MMFVKRGVDLNQVDFCFGGSTLQMLATKDASDPYFACRIPGTKCILVTKKKQYEFDLADLGFQFERCVKRFSSHNRNFFNGLIKYHITNLSWY